MEKNRKISFYGLSRSGKSCYIFAMAQALSQGLCFPDGEILTVKSPIPMQMAKLYKSYQQMTDGRWPAGNTESVDYKFNARLRLEKLMSFNLKDYRGGLLDTCDEDEIDEQDELFSSFEDSAVLLFFVGADTVIKAMEKDVESNIKLNFLSTLYENFLDRTNDARTPVMIVISKSDMLSPQELLKAKEFTKNKLQSMFGHGTNITAAITTVTLGKNLSNENGELEGDLIIGPTAGNIHIPIIYSLFCVISNKIEEAVGKLSSAQDDYKNAQNELNNEMSKSAFEKFFNNNENKIRNRINSSNNIIGKEKEALIELNNTLSKIKPFLLNGADVYINGTKL